MLVTRPTFAFALSLLATIATLLTTGCGSSKPYTAKMHDGRIYLIGQQETLKSFNETGHLPYTKTFIGAGPAGETIIAEVDKEDPQYANTLLAAYYDNTWFYREVMHDGRLYVIGNPETYEAFKQNGHLAYTKTLIGAGPNGETIVFENEKSGSELVNRLMTHYDLKHATKG